MSDNLQKNKTATIAQKKKLHTIQVLSAKMLEEVRDFAMLLLDINGTILNWSPGAENIKGYKEEEVVGKNFSIFYTVEDQNAKLPMLLLEKVVKDGRATSEGWRVKKGGSTFWASNVITALHDDNGVTIGFSKLTSDLTEQKLSQEYIVKQNAILQEFAYVASHDLQEPLRKIILFSNMIERDITQQESILKYLTKIVNASDRMSKLINGVLDYSKIESKELKSENVDLNVIFSQILEDFDLLIKECGARIIFPEQRLPSLKANAIQIHQLFANLISNAIKFNDGIPEISISFEKLLIDKVEFAKISISDNGIGFDPVNAEKIFTMFHRVNVSKPGTGIGLALCNRIVQSNGGSIIAKSTLGNGSVFEVFLPLSNCL